MIAPTSFTSATATPIPRATPPEPTPVLTSDFETFLQMLTAQAKYQDPLEPIGSSEYAAQLAQFSMVEQQVLSNDLLTALTSQLGSGNMAQMANWIGMEARTTAPVKFDGAPITVNPNPVAVADDVQLVVYDVNGTEVQRQNIPVSSAPVEWAGVSEDGTPFTNGLYRFEVESRANGELLLAEPAETYARITEARVDGTDTLLILEGGTPVIASSVTGLREPA
ncbi:hypothetical protein C1J03_22990 [Sulfitobacter sp. SK012]|uniref:flagellar hook capping FlgD N-terminal domain-containing protein n=1 Tax=Sulfitobacter sp. SK012 TaxID=1389005 RepID=UPI000E0A26E9|nr:flagellar hook capping FlgD N-terminal domain-containing protein [Sulfitobacter sp. SK012]AXI48611.1 hypothetical protein C1J03_22990 [Sulfitobacter sp. SK012]